MKNFFLILFLILLLLAVGLTVFVVTAGVDQYRPFVIQKIEEAIGKPVDLGYLSLTWSNGLALKLQRLSIYSGTTKQSEPAVQLQEADATVQFLPLLHKEVEITSVKLVEPYLYLVRSLDGSVKIYGMEAAKKPVPAAAGEIPVAQVPAPVQPTVGTSAGAVAALPLFVGLVQIEDGKIHFHDETKQMAKDVSIENLDVTLKNVALDRPVEIQGHFSLFSQRPNISFNGLFQFDLQKQAALVKKFHLETDLGLWDISSLMQTMPDLAQIKIEGKPAGTLNVDVGPFGLDPAGMKELNAQILLSGGKIKLADLKSPIEEATMDATVQMDRAELKSLTAHFAGGTVALSGAADRLSTQPLTHFALTVQKLALENLAPPANSGDPELKGNLSVSFEGTAQGKDAAFITQTLAGQGRIQVENGVVKNLNVLKEVFQKLSVIPGLINNLQSRLPESYQEKLNAKDTLFEPMDFPVKVQTGIVYLDQVQVKTDTFQIQGSGRGGLNGRVDAQAVLIADPDLSQAFIRSVNELSYLATPQGELQIPLKIWGNAPQIKVLPDVPNLASKVAIGTLGSLLEGRKGKREEMPSTTNTDETAQPQKPLSKMKGKDLFGQLLQSALQGSTSDKNPPQN